MGVGGWVGARRVRGTVRVYRVYECVRLYACGSEHYCGGLEQACVRVLSLGVHVFVA